MNAFPLSEDTIKKVHDTFNVTENSINRDVEILQNWLKQQPHLPQTLPFDNFFEKVLLNRKFSVERSKETIENLFTLKTNNQELYNYFLEKEIVKLSKSILILVTLPKLGPNNERLVFMYCNPENTVSDEYFVQIWLGTLYLFYKYDYANGARLIVDLKDMKMEYAASVPISIVYSTAQMIMKGFPIRIHGIEILNMQPMFQLFLNIMKTISPKITEKIRYHKDLTSLHRILPPEYLPEELGGSNDNANQRIEKIENILIDHKDELQNFAKIVTNEKLRVERYSNSNHMFGMEGTFKTLSFD